MPYLGRLPSSLLKQGRIQPTEHRDWPNARRYFARRDKDRIHIDQLKASIAKHGLREPITIGISARYPDDVYVGDGHHRAIALMDLGVPTFPFHWYWIKGWGVRMERGPFPYATLGIT